MRFKINEKLKILNINIMKYLIKIFNININLKY